MKVLFLTKHYPPAEGGIERNGHMLCTDLVEAGVDVEVVASAEGRIASQIEEVDGVKVHRLDRQLSINSAPITFDLPRLLRSKAAEFDMIHINFPNPWTDLLYLALCRDRKALLTYHADIDRPRNSLGGLLLKGYNPFMHRVLNRVSAIVVTSPNNLENSPSLRPYAAKCHVIPMPVDGAALQQVDDAAVEQERSRFGDFVFFIGRHVAYKGVRYLIEAMEQVRQAQLVIGSRGPLEEELKRQARECGLAERVHFVGRISDGRRRALFHACRCFVLPSVSPAEAFGIAMAEAMACGKPAISTDLGTGTSFVNLDGVTGYVVEPRSSAALAKKINALLGDEEMCTRLGRQARERAMGEFDRSIVVERTRRLYGEVLAG